MALEPNWNPPSPFNIEGVSPCWLKPLPIEILHEVVRRLSALDLCRLSQVSRSARLHCSDNVLWRRLCYEDYCRFDEYIYGTTQNERSENFFWKFSYGRFYPPIKLEFTMVTPTNNGKPPQKIEVGPKTLFLGRKEETLNKGITRLHPSSGDGPPTCHSAVIEGDHISGVHCKIWYDKETKEFYVADCRSRNGTFFASPISGSVGGPLKWECLGDRNHTTSKHPLSYRSSIKLGLVVLRVTFIAGVTAPTPERPSPSLKASWSGEFPPRNNHELVLHIVAGPGTGQRHVVSPAVPCLVGRVAQNPGVQDELEWGLDYRPDHNVELRNAIARRRNLLIDDSAKTISRRHMQVAYDPLLDAFVLDSRNHRTWVCAQADKTTAFEDAFLPSKNKCPAGAPPEDPLTLQTSGFVSDSDNPSRLSSPTPGGGEMESADWTSGFSAEASPALPPRSRVATGAVPPFARLPGSRVLRAPSDRSSPTMSPRLSPSVSPRGGGSHGCGTGGGLEGSDSGGVLSGGGFPAEGRRTGRAQRTKARHSRNNSASARTRTRSADLPQMSAEGTNGEGQQRRRRRCSVGEHVWKGKGAGQGGSGSGQRSGSGRRSGSGGAVGALPEGASGTAAASATAPAAMLAGGANEQDPADVLALADVAAALPWKRLDVGSRQAIHPGDVVQCGRSTIIAIRPHEGPPERMGVPRVRAVLRGLRVEWDAGVSLVHIQSYHVQLRNVEGDYRFLEHVQLCALEEECAGGVQDEIAQGDPQYHFSSPDENDEGWCIVSAGSSRMWNVPYLPDGLYQVRVAALSRGGRSEWSAPRTFCFPHVEDLQ